MSGRNLVVLAAAAAATLAASSCLDLEPLPDATRWYVLDAPPEEGAGATGAVGDEDAPAVGVVVQAIAGHLEPPALAVRVAPHEVRYLDGHRWAAPLAEGIERSLAGALDALPGVRGRASVPGTEGALLELDVRRFEGARDGDPAALVEIGWRLGEEGGTFRARGPWSGAPDELAAVLARTLATLAPEVAARLAAR